MTDASPSDGVPVFTLKPDGITFRCWTVDAGRFEWRSTCGRFRVSRNEGSAACSAWRDKQLIGDHFGSLKAAIVAATGGAAKW